MLTCKYTGLKEIDRRTVIDRTCAGLNFYVEAHHVKRLNLYDAHRVMFIFLSLFSSLTLSLSQHGGRGNRFILHTQKIFNVHATNCIVPIPEHIKNMPQCFRNVIFLSPYLEYVI